MPKPYRASRVLAAVGVMAGVALVKLLPFAAGASPMLVVCVGGAASLAAYVPAGMYTYTASSCPDDGNYTFTKRTSDCFNNTWHTVSSDHTGAGNF